MVLFNPHFCSYYFFKEGKYLVGLNSRNGNSFPLLILFRMSNTIGWKKSVFHTESADAEVRQDDDDVAEGGKGTDVVDLAWTPLEIVSGQKHQNRVAAVRDTTYKTVKKKKKCQSMLCMSGPRWAFFLRGIDRQYHVAGSGMAFEEMYEKTSAYVFADSFLPGNCRNYYIVKKEQRNSDEVQLNEARNKTDR